MALVMLMKDLPVELHLHPYLLVLRFYIISIIFYLCTAVDGVFYFPQLKLRFPPPRIPKNKNCSVSEVLWVESGQLA